MKENNKINPVISAESKGVPGGESCFPIALLFPSAGTSP